MGNIFILVPVLNEEGNVSRLIEDWHSLTKELVEYQCNFVVIDDGSTDETVAMFRSQNKGLSIEIISHDKNYGPGFAFATGFEFLSSKMRDSDIIITIEGDNTSRVELIRTMIERMQRENVDVVLASPYAYGGTIINTSFHRMFLSHIANGLVKTVLGIHGIHTMSSFFRVYRASVITKLQSQFGVRIIERNGFECMIELLKKIILLECSVSEIPMKLDTSRRVGKSKMKVLRTIRGYVQLFFIGKKW